jgi:hypothetical protein
MSLFGNRHTSGTVFDDPGGGDEIYPTDAASMGSRLIRGLAGGLIKVRESPIITMGSVIHIKLPFH